MFDYDASRAHPAPVTSDRIAQTAAALDRIVADLEFVRTIGVLAPGRRDSLQQAAEILRSFNNGTLAAAISDTLNARGF